MLTAISIYFLANAVLLAAEWATGDLSECACGYQTKLLTEGIEANALCCLLTMASITLLVGWPCKIYAGLGNVIEGGLD